MPDKLQVASTPHLDIVVMPVEEELGMVDRVVYDAYGCCIIHHLAQRHRQRISA